MRRKLAGLPAGATPCIAAADVLSYISSMKRNIILHPDPRLKSKADPVSDLSDELRALADDMLETMYDAPGIGLAAPQVGVLQRLVVLDCMKNENDTPRPLIMFNPEIIATSDETNVYEEGCLSIPEQFADVTRPAEVEVRWIDRNGKEVTETFDGLWATCAQHEIDHLDGKLFIDYLKPLRRQMITRKMIKKKRELARG
jgi:peptide deformylase